MNENIDIKKYKEAAKLHRKYSFDGQFEKANKEYSNLKKIFEKFKNGDLEIELLIQLLESKSIEVQGWAAAHLLGLNTEIKKATKVLKKLKKCDNKKIAFSAKMTLQVWEEEGFLKF